MTRSMAFCPKGFNLGGWMSQSPLTVEHVETFLGPRDFQTIASWGFNSVRLPVDAPFLFSEEGRGALRPERWRMLRRALGWAWDAGLHVALDLHQCPWHSFTDPSLKALWEDDQALSMLCARWEELVSALKGCEGPLWLDLLNEPTAADPADWNRVARRLVGAVHGVDPARTVVVESTQWGHVDHLESLANALEDPSVVLSFHFYEPLFFTHQRAPWWTDGAFFQGPMEYPGSIPGWKEDLARPDLPSVGRCLLEKRGPVYWDKDALRKLLSPVFALRARGRQIYCGEFGAYEKSPRASRLAYLEDMMRLLTEAGAGWAYWNYKWLDFGIYAKTPQGGTADVDEEVVAILKRGL